VRASAGKCLDTEFELTRQRRGGVVVVRVVRANDYLLAGGAVRAIPLGGEAYVLALSDSRAAHAGRLVGGVHLTGLKALWPDVVRPPRDGSTIGEHTASTRPRRLQALLQPGRSVAVVRYRVRVRAIQNSRRSLLVLDY
jgi:hypothetical protein